MSASGSGLGAWLEQVRDACDMTVTRVPLDECVEWSLVDGELRHRTGGFFGVVGLESTDHRGRRTTQPIIDQPEVGLLGFVTAGTGPDARVLVQAKPEPGNTGLVQAAPTVQATRSNYLRLHGGSPTPLLELFSTPGHGGGPLLADSEQSEQGTRFLGKYNRNTVVAADEAIEDLPALLHWWPVSDLLEALSADSLVNTDARSVVAIGPWERWAVDGCPFGRWDGSGEFGELLGASYRAGGSDATSVHGWLAARQASAHADVRRLPLSRLPGWTCDKWGVRAEEGPGLEVRYARVLTTQREVSEWSQPLLAASPAGRATLLAQQREGVLRLQFVARPEPGLAEGCQLGPSLLDTPGEAAHAEAPPGTTVLKITQSDEGGRFWHAESEYSVLLLDETTTAPDGPDSCWLTLREVRDLLPRRGVFTNESRTLVSLLAALL